MRNLIAFTFLFMNIAAAEEAFRPAFHFSPEKNWTNDPNGLVYFEGEYHLFFQYNPFGDTWGHMSWGHAVSSDLLHWKQLPVALAEENGVMIFTGSVVVDRNNTSGFCLNGKPCLVAVWTGHRPKPAPLQTQNIAYSNDRGRTWTKYQGNPVLDLHKADFRDPKVFWYEPAKRWTMLVSLPEEHRVLFYSSPDLKQWTKLSSFGPQGAASTQWECPEFFEMRVEGKKQSRWVMKIGINPGSVAGGSGEQYFVGSFDGKTFTNENPASLALWTDYGKDCYCALTYGNLPSGPVTMGWMANWDYASKLPTAPFRGQMTLARRLSLRETADGLRLFAQPLGTISKLRQASVPLSKSIKATGKQFQFESTIDFGSAREVGWKILLADGAYTQIGYDRAKGVVFVDRTHSGNVDFDKKFPARTEAPLRVDGDTLRLNVIVDTNSVEVFAQDGRVTLTNLVFPPPAAEGVEFYAAGGQERKAQGTLWRLKP